MRWPSQKHTSLWSSRGRFESGHAAHLIGVSRCHYLIMETEKDLLQETMLNKQLFLKRKDVYLVKAMELFGGVVLGRDLTIGSVSSVMEMEGRREMEKQILERRCKCGSNLIQETVEGPFAGYYCCDPDWMTIIYCVNHRWYNFWRHFSYASK